MKRIIYADNAATTKLDIDAFEAMKPYLLDEYGNASQPYSFSRKPKQALQRARKTIAQCINADPEEIYFTSGGTESNNWAIKGVALASSEKKKMITSQIEHHAILRACADIEKLGHSVAYLPVTTQGIVDIKTFENTVNFETNLVSIMYANNEIGTIQPIEQLCLVAHKNGSLFHTDAVQAVGHINIDVKKLGIDMLSASAHKFNGPKGVGFLYVKKGTPICSYASGGSQEFHMRAGTENVSSIVGMAVALEKTVMAIEETTKHLHMLETLFLQGLKKENIPFVRNGTNQIPGNLSVSFEGVSGETLLHRLDLLGIIVSTGSACNGLNDQISHVLEAIGLEEQYAKGTIRITLSANNTEEDIRAIIKSIVKILSH